MLGLILRLRSVTVLPLALIATAACAGSEGAPSSSAGGAGAAGATATAGTGGSTASTGGAGQSGSTASGGATVASGGAGQGATSYGDASITPAQCGATTCTNRRPICDPSTNQCVQCLIPTDCADPSQPFCSTENRCEQCLVDTDCPAGNHCVGNECAPTCATNTDCGGDGGSQTPYCDTAQAVCVECLESANCAGTSSPVCSAEGQCVECATDSDCTPPETCASWGRCMTSSLDGGAP